jgi:hypothetical protein
MSRLNNNKKGVNTIWIVVIAIAILLVILIIGVFLYYSLTKNKSLSNEGDIAGNTPDLNPGLNDSGLNNSLNTSCTPVWNCMPWSNGAGQCGSRDCIDTSDCPLKQEPFKIETKVC